MIYTPSGTYQSSWPPVVTTPGCVAPGSSYVVGGNQLNGLTQGAYYGDDQQASTNYPLVRIVNNSTVAASTELGASTLYVVANGIPSAGTAVTVASACATLQVAPPANIPATGNYGGP